MQITEKIRVRPPHRSLLHTFSEGGRVQLRVIGALILREMQTRYGRENIGYLWAVIEPLILLLMFLGIYYMTGRTLHNGMNMVSFLATGIMTFQSIKKIVSSIASATDANKGLLLYPQVTPVDTMLARVVLESATFITVFAVIIIGGWFLGKATLPYDLFGVILALAAISMLSVSIGLLQDVVITVFPLIDKVMGPIWRVMFFTSCVFYSMIDMPLAVQHVMQYNPIAHVIELLRKSFFPNFRTPIHDYSYVFWVSGICVFLGLLIERLYRYKDVQAT